MARGNGSKVHSQEELLLDAAGETEEALDASAQVEDDTAEADRAGGVEDEDPAVASDAQAVQSLAAELVSTLDGCWMITRHGQRVELSDEEWRKELAHALARNRPPASS